jgi:hypothetical protein
MTWSKRTTDGKCRRSEIVYSHDLGIKSLRGVRPSGRSNACRKRNLLIRGNVPDFGSHRNTQIRTADRIIAAISPK